ncbi:YveK family protein [Acetoanaerobium sticklandii]|uniref:YveK family protein n=1 Tax=Acetoanaerobium sticklandii TaxID=1511 RepID=UPI003A948E51
MEKQEEISFADLTHILFKKRIIGFKVFALVAILTFIYAFSPLFENNYKYEASSSISIIYNYKTPTNPEEISEGYVYYQDRMQNNMIPTIKGYIESYTLLRNVISELDIKNKKGEYLRVKKLKENIEIVNPNGSNLIMISVKDSNNKIAEDIANEIPRKLVEMAKANENLKDYEIVIIDKAMSYKLNSNTLPIFLIFGLAFGLVLGIIASFISTYYSKRIQLPSYLTENGFEVDLILNKQLSKTEIDKILYFVMLANFESVLIGLDDNIEKYNIEYIKEMFDENEIKINILNYTDNNFLVQSKLYDKTFIIVEENFTNKDHINQISKLNSKYNLGINAIYIEK